MSTKFGSDPEVQRSLIRASTAVVIVVLVMAVVLVWANKTEEITRLGLLASQGIATLFNFWMINRSALTTNARVDEVRQEIKNGRKEPL